MRAIRILAVVAALQAEPLRWAELSPPLRALLTEAGLTESAYPGWQAKHSEGSRERLASGAAEHIAYFLLQSKALITDPPLDPALEARRYLNSLPAADRSAFLAGERREAPVGEPVRRRMEAFWKTPPATERHLFLRDMAKRLGWTPEEVVLTAFRFLVRQTGKDEPDALYQARGLSADPFPASMRAVALGIKWLRAHRPAPIANILLLGPGAEFGSRFGVDDSQPVMSPQPGALLALLARRPATFDCADIRPEVVATLAKGPCRASTLDVVTQRIPGGPYDLAVATNVLVYLDDLELAAALANLSLVLRPGGCLLHNDSRFAVRLFGEAAGMPVVHFQAVQLGTRGGREQVDRIVVHCKAM